MPAIDSGRQRARLSRAHLDVVNHVLRGVDVPAESADAELELVEAELLIEGRPLAFLAELTSQLTQAQVSVDVEIAGRDGFSTHGAVISADTCWTMSGWPRTTEQEYALLDQRLLPTWLAATLGLRTEGASESEEDLETVLGALDAALLERGLAEARAISSDLDDPLPTTVSALADLPAISTRLAQVLAFERRAWRVTCSWREEDGIGVAALAVIDAGPQGLWQRVLPAAPIGPEPLAPTTLVRFHRLSPSEVFHAVGSLVSSRRN